MSSPTDNKHSSGSDGAIFIIALFIVLAIIILGGVGYSVKMIKNINNDKVEPYLAIINNNLGVNPKLLKVISHIQDYQTEQSNQNLKKLKTGYRIMRASIMNDLASDNTIVLHVNFGDPNKLATIADSLNSLESMFEDLADDQHDQNLIMVKAYRETLDNLYREWNTYSRRVIQKVQQAHADTWEGWNQQLKIQLYFLLLVALTSILATGIMYYLFRKQIRTRRSLEKRTLELNDARLMAEQSTRAKSRFLANMSHEIRTPLNGIIGLSKLSYSKEKDEEIRGYLESIVLSGNSLLSIINDVLDISKIEANKMTLEETDFVLEDIVRPITASMSFAARTKNISFLVLTPPSLSIGLKGDSTKLSQILNNLCSNAIKFTEQGGVCVEIAACRTAHKIILQMSVRDSGLGLDANQQRQVFDEFVQADDSTTRKFGGTGLGLSITRSFVELMGGTINLISSPNNGSTFSIKIPFSMSEDNGEPARLSLSDNERAQLDALNLKVICSDSYELSEIKADLKRYNLYDPHEPFTHWLYSSIQDIDDVEARIATSIEQPDLPGIFFVSGDSVTDVKAFFDNAAIFESPYSTSRLLNYLLNVEESSNALETKPLSQALLGKSVLVAEDNQVNQVVAQATLDQLGALVTFADNGVECIEALRTTKYDLILMDIQMPEMDGVEATKYILDHELAPGTPIVALTANVFKEDIERYLEAGMDAHLPKPFDSEELCHLVVKLIA